MPAGCLDVTWGDSAAEDACAECEDGYELDSGLCVPTPREVDENCAAADDDGWCVECAEGFVNGE